MVVLVIILLVALDLTLLIVEMLVVMDLYQMLVLEEQVVQRMVDLPPPAIPARYDLVRARGHRPAVELI